MSLWDDFSQNWRPKFFREKIAIFTRRVPVENVKTLKTWLWVFSATKQPEERETSPHGLWPEHESVRQFQSKLKTKIFSEKIAIFTRRGAGKTCETLKTWLWVFSAIDILRNVKLHNIDYRPNMCLWDDFIQNRRRKFFRKKIAIFTRRVSVENVKTLKTWLWVF